MMRVVWKFPLQVRGWNRVEVGLAAKVVLTAIDPASGAPAVWIEHLVDEGGHPQPRFFGVFPTGGRIAANADHVGSMVDRTFVWHIYERRD